MDTYIIKVLTPYLCQNHMLHYLFIEISISIVVISFIVVVAVLMFYHYMSFLTYGQWCVPPTNFRLRISNTFLKGYKTKQNFE